MENYTPREISQNHWGLFSYVNEEHATPENQYIVETATFDDRAQSGKTSLKLRYEVRGSNSQKAHGRISDVHTLQSCKAISRLSKRPTPRYSALLLCRREFAIVHVTETGNNIKVKFCRSHCGHEVQPAVLSIDPKSEQYIVSLLREGFGPHQILKKIRAECRENDTHLRLYYASYSDIRLIGIRNNGSVQKR
ncbi:hypothetical protein OSTOST_11507 [Ostertagia ostertagi]